MVSTSGNQKGGGYGGRQHVETKVRTGTGSRGTNPGGVGQLGQSQGSHVTRGGESSYRGEPLHSGRNFQKTEFGNAIAARTVCGPGGSRNVYASGSQGQTGTNPGNPRPVPDRHVIESYGPDYRRPHNPGRSDVDADES
jgi:hypothetical protein